MKKSGCKPDEGQGAYWMFCEECAFQHWLGDCGDFLKDNNTRKESIDVKCDCGCDCRG